MGSGDREAPSLVHSVALLLSAGQQKKRTGLLRGLQARLLRADVRLIIRQMLADRAGRGLWLVGRCAGRKRRLSTNVVAHCPLFSSFHALPKDSARCFTNKNSQEQLLDPARF